MLDPKLISVGLVILLILVLVYVFTTAPKENVINQSNVDTTESWVKLYENFTFSGPSSYESAVGTFIRKGPGYQKLDLKINLKSFDINVIKGNVQLWAIYPDESVASSSATGVSGFGDAYSDTLPWNSLTKPSRPPSSETNAYRAIDSTKYRKIVEVTSGNHVTGMVDFPVKRILLYVNLDQ